MSATFEPEFEAPLPTHFHDALRIGVLVGEEGAELSLQAHFMHCEFYREPALRLLRQVGLGPQAQTPAPQLSCAQARNALFRYFEQGRDLIQPELDHLNACGSCGEHFLGPVRCARYDEVEDDIPALG